MIGEREGGKEKQYLDRTSLICHIMMFSQMDLLSMFGSVSFQKIKQCYGVRRTISVLEVADETMQVIITGRNIMRREAGEYNFA